MNCVCDLNLLKNDCICQALINKQRKAVSPVELMRSRYVAFATGEADYLFETSSKALQQMLTVQKLQESCDSTQFIGLEIIDHNEDSVEFKAKYLVDSLFGIIHETSKFIKEDDNWKYDTGTLHPTVDVNIKRNDICPCGSDKKFKKCHMK